jgi:hypothetical protein
VANVQNIYRLPSRIDSEDDSVRLENRLPKVLLHVLSFSGETATLGEALQRVDPIVESLKPTRGIQWSAFANVSE